MAWSRLRPVPPIILSFRLKRLKPTCVSSTRSTAANFTCSRIWRGSGGGGAFNRLITVLARVCAMPARRLESSALLTEPASTMVSPEPAAVTAPHSSFSAIFVERLPGGACRRGKRPPPCAGQAGADHGVQHLGGDRAGRGRLGGIQRIAQGEADLAFVLGEFQLLGVFRRQHQRLRGAKGAPWDACVWLLRVIMSSYLVQGQLVAGLGATLFHRPGWKLEHGMSQKTGREPPRPHHASGLANLVAFVEVHQIDRKLHEKRMARSGGDDPQAFAWRQPFVL